VIIYQGSGGSIPSPKGKHKQASEWPSQEIKECVTFSTKIKRGEMIKKLLRKL
jgi:hypothetical protein